MNQDESTTRTAEPGGLFNGEKNGEFTGVWIPAEVVLAEDLGASEKMAYAVIASFRSFFGSNAWLGSRLGLSEDRARKIVAGLISKGYVRRVAFDGRKRVLRAVRDFDRPVQNHAVGANKVDGTTSAAKDECPTVSAAEAPQKPSKAPQNAKPEARGNLQINRAFDRWAELFGVPQKPSAANRCACWNLLRSKDKGPEWLDATMRLALAAQRDKYAGRKVNGNSGFADLQANWPDIWLWGRRQAEAQRQGGVEDLNAMRGGEQ